VFGGAFALIAIVLYWAFQGPYENYKNSAAQVTAARLRVQQAQLWEAEIEAVREKEARLVNLMEGLSPGFDLWTHVDRAVKDSELVGRAEVVSSRTGAAPGSKMSAIDLTLKGVSTSELVALLHEIYDDESFVVMERLDELKPATSGQGLDCRMRLVAPKL
jgi:hypothetical protein